MADLVRILEKLDDEEREAVLQQWPREDRMDVRDRELRAIARDHFLSQSTRRQAQQIQRHLDLLTGLRVPLIEDGTLRGRLIRVLRLNGGRSLGWQQIANILMMARTPQRILPLE